MKTYNYIFIMVGLMILLSFAGIDTTSGYVLGKLNIIDNPENIQGGGLNKELGAIFLAIAVGGIAIGFLTKSSPEIYLIAPFAAILILFLGDVISIITYMKGNYPESVWMYRLTLLVLGSIAVGFIISVVEWWRGTD